MAKERIGVVAPGRTGLATVKRLISDGGTVTVTDIDSDQVEMAAAVVPDWAGQGADPS